MNSDDRKRNLFPFHSFSAHKKPPRRYAAEGSVLLCEFFFYFFECHFERMPA